MQEDFETAARDPEINEFLFKLAADAENSAPPLIHDEQSGYALLYVVDENTQIAVPLANAALRIRKMYDEMAARSDGARHKFRTLAEKIITGLEERHGPGAALGVAQIFKKDSTGVFERTMGELCSKLGPLAAEEIKIKVPAETEPDPAKAVA